MRRHTLRVVVLAAALLGVSACTTAPTALPTAATPPSSSSSSSSAAPAASCTNRLQSYAPSAGTAAGPTVAAIKARGRLIAGVSADTYLLGSRNPLSGQIEGFDIDLVNRIAQAILGPQAKVELRVITAADRIPLLQKHEVDIVVRNMTITCDRWKQIAFSAEYYHAGQKILVRKGSDIKDMNTMSGKKVCAPAKTTSMDNLMRLAPGVVVVSAGNHTGCLVALQEGKAEAITGDDTVLAGLARQDPYAVVLPGAAVTEEPYGVGVAADQVDLVRFINATLAAYEADGGWKASYDKWLAPALGAGATPPTPQYGRT